MQEQAINTFEEGLVMDLNPLTTPNNVLTNALNGTMITFNGNEFVLQNDMGNGRVETAYLPSGYVPVGIKEYGGIIYVASYNPITNKGQIGSFPSPERNISSDEVGAPNLIIDKSSFGFNTASGVSSHILKFSIFGEDSSNVLRAGDKFAIQFIYNNPKGNSWDDLRALISNFDNYNTLLGTERLLNIKLAILDSNGNLRDITKELKRLDFNGNLVNLPEGTPLEEYLSTGYFLQKIEGKLSNNFESARKVIKQMNVYNNKLSGELFLIVEINSITSYEVEIYGEKNNKKATLEFIGSYEDVYPNVDDTNSVAYDNCKWEGIISSFTELDRLDSPSNLPLENTYYIRGKNSGERKHSVSISELDSTKLFKWEITPVLKMGPLPIYKRSGVIDLNLLGTGDIYLKRWSYYNDLQNNITTITWGLDAYTRKGETINSVEFDFFNLRDFDGTSSGVPYRYPCKARTIYNGVFTETLPLSDVVSENSIYKNSLYLVKIVIDKTYRGETSKNFEWRFLYTTTLFNRWYGVEDDFKSLELGDIEILVDSSFNDSGMSTYTSDKNSGQYNFDTSQKYTESQFWYKSLVLNDGTISISSIPYINEKFPFVFTKDYKIKYTSKSAKISIDNFKFEEVGTPTFNPSGLSSQTANEGPFWITSDQVVSSDEGYMLPYFNSEADTEYKKQLNYKTGVKTEIVDNTLKLSWNVLYEDRSSGKQEQRSIQGLLRFQPYLEETKESIERVFGFKGVMDISTYQNFTTVGIGIDSNGSEGNNDGNAWANLCSIVNNNTSEEDEIYRTNIHAGWRGIATKDWMPKLRSMLSGLFVVRPSIVILTNVPGYTQPAGVRKKTSAFIKTSSPETYLYNYSIPMFYSGSGYVISNMYFEGSNADSRNKAVVKSLTQYFSDVYIGSEVSSSDKISLYAIANSIYTEYSSKVLVPIVPTVYNDNGLITYINNSSGKEIIVTQDLLLSWCRICGADNVDTNNIISSTFSKRNVDSQEIVYSNTVDYSIKNKIRDFTSNVQFASNIASLPGGTTSVDYLGRDLSADTIYLLESGELVPVSESSSSKAKVMSKWFIVGTDEIGRKTLQANNYKSLWNGFNGGDSESAKLEVIPRMQTIWATKKDNSNLTFTLRAQSNFEDIELPLRVTESGVSQHNLV